MPFVWDFKAIRGNAVKEALFLPFFPAVLSVLIPRHLVLLSILLLLCPYQIPVYMLYIPDYASWMGPVLFLFCFSFFFRIFWGGKGFLSQVIRMGGDALFYTYYSGTPLSGIGRSSN